MLGSARGLLLAHGLFFSRRRLRPLPSSLLPHSSFSAAAPPPHNPPSNNDDDDDITSPPRRHSKYMGVHWHSRAKRFIAEVRHKGQRVLYKAFPTQEEAAAARAVDAAIRQHLGDDMLTNFHAATGVFLDPRHALDDGGKKQTEVGKARGPAGAVTFVPEMQRYKAVVKQRGRPILLGLYATEDEAIKELRMKTGGPVGKGGMAEAPKQSKYLGVTWDSHHLKWVARLHHGGARGT